MKTSRKLPEKQTEEEKKNYVTLDLFWHKQNKEFFSSKFVPQRVKSDFFIFEVRFSVATQISNLFLYEETSTEFK
jgi:hypothetical protein